ncbi:MAG: sigma-70 family RNA polymerase sigma factor [Pseudomonadota bacterium]
MSRHREHTLRRWLKDHGAMIERIASTYERRPALVAELTQDVALALWRALPDFRAEASDRTFVARIAHNVGISHVRRAVARPPGLSDDALAPVADEGPSLEHITDRAQQRARLQGAVRALPLSLRAVMALHLEGFSNIEIGHTLSLSPNNVGVRLARARSQLKAALESAQ